MYFVPQLLVFFVSSFLLHTKQFRSFSTTLIPILKSPTSLFCFVVVSMEAKKEQKQKVSLIPQLLWNTLVTV